MVIISSFFHQKPSDSGIGAIDSDEKEAISVPAAMELSLGETSPELGHQCQGMSNSSNALLQLNIN